MPAALESAGLLGSALETFRVFHYETLAGTVRVSDGRARMDLSLTGRRRVGLFPGLVQSINVKNLPLDALATGAQR